MRIDRYLSLCSDLGLKALTAGSTTSSHLSALRREDTRLDHAIDAGVLGLGELLSHAIFTLVEARLLEPGQGPAAVDIEIAFLLDQCFVEDLIDQR